MKPTSNGVDSQYTIRDGPLNSSSRVSVVCIGSGVSGIITAIRAQETLKNCDFAIYEKNSDLGGTWFENTYPGCKCDVPAHAYTYTFEPNPDYSEYYIGNREIHAYLKAVAEKYQIRKYVHFNHKLVSAVWNEESGLWELSFEIFNPDRPEEKECFQRTCNVFINAGGLLNNWKWPAIPGLTTFKGHLCHSAAWKDYEWAGKTVAVLGSGSSAIQIDPELQPIVGKLKAFIRSPTWIAPSQGFVDPKNEATKNFRYTAEDKKKFREDPDEFLRYRKQIEADMNRTFDLFFKDTEKQQVARTEFAKIMKGRLGGNEELAEKLTPKFAVGCRRLTPGENFLESLVKENVEVITDEIDRIEPEGLVTSDGKLHKVDAIVCATGFDTTYKPRFKLVGRQGIPLSDLWADTNAVEAYLAMAIPGFPNYFMFLGPNAPISNGTLMPVFEKQCEYMIGFISKLQRQNIKAFAVKQEVVTQLNIHHQNFLQTMVFSDACRSWYKGGKKDGKVIGIWPGSSLHYYEMLADPRYEDFDYVYQDDNMWSFLGNGLTLRETKDSETHSEDLAYYLIKPKEVLRAPES